MVQPQRPRANDIQATLFGRGQASGMPARRRCLAWLGSGLGWPGVGGLAGLGAGGGLAGCAHPGGASAPDVAAPAAGWTPDPRLPALDAPQQLRLVNRITWGANDAELARLQQLGASAYVRAQLQPPAAPGTDLPAPLQQQVQALRISQQDLPALWQAMDAQRRAVAAAGAAAASAVEAEEARRLAQRAYQLALNGLASEAASRHLWQAVHGQHQLQAQMVWFWLNHFSVFQGKGSLRLLVGDYEARAIAPHALGRFRDLLGAAVKHPAMLSYLDNTQNAANRLNENLARELLELHTVGVNGGYSQADVQVLARVLTGHGLNGAATQPSLRAEWQPLYRRDGLYEFHPGRHDFSAKTLLGLRLPGSGAAELEQVLDHLARQPATAQRVCRKMAQHLLGGVAPAPLVARMAQAFLAHDGHIGATLQVLVTAPEFVADTPQAFKTPVQYLVSAVRACCPPGLLVRNPAPLQAWLGRLGQGLYQRSTPDGYPLTADAWTGSGQLESRFDIARLVASGQAPLYTPPGSPALPAAQRPNPAALARSQWLQLGQPRFADSTRLALAAAATPLDFGTLLLASPEFMRR